MNFQKLLVGLLLIAAGWLHAEIAIASLNNLGLPMTYGVCDTTAAVSSSGGTAFIAPIEGRADSRVNGFHASFLLESGNVISLYPGYVQELAEMFQVYRKTTNVRLAANRDFTAFAVIVEKINTGTTPPGSDVTIPTTLGTWLAIVDAFGNTIREAELASSEGSVSARLCHVSFADDGRLLVAAGQYLGLRLYDSPTTDLTSFTTLDVGYKTGTAVITGDGAKVFFTQDDASQRAVCYMDTTTNEIVDTGLTADGGINDAQVSVNHDGSCVAFRKTAGSLSICSLEDGGAWKETVIEGTQIRNPAISSDGRYIVYQTRGTSCLQIMEYDRQKGKTTPLSRNDGGAEADADCTSPSISADGSRIAFISSASNLVSNGNGQAQLYIVKREAPSVTLDLKRGWNFCGTPLTLDDESIALLKKESTCWVWTNGRFHMMEVLRAGQGFWLYALEDKMLQLTGEETEPLPLRHGWNLVMPSLYPEAEQKACFALEDCLYVRLANPTNYKGTAWVFY